MAMTEFVDIKWNCFGNSDWCLLMEARKVIQGKPRPACCMT